jgi:hypothetical protein
MNDRRVTSISLPHLIFEISTTNNHYFSNIESQSIPAYTSYFTEKKSM